MAFALRHAEVLQSMSEAEVRVEEPIDDARFRGLRELRDWRRVSGGSDLPQHDLLETLRRLSPALAGTTVEVAGADPGSVLRPRDLEELQRGFSNPDLAPAGISIGSYGWRGGLDLVEHCVGVRRLDLTLREDGPDAILLSHVLAMHENNLVALSLSAGPVDASLVVDSVSVHCHGLLELRVEATDPWDDMDAVDRFTSALSRMTSLQSLELSGHVLNCSSAFPQLCQEIALRLPSLDALQLDLQYYEPSLMLTMMLALQHRARPLRALKLYSTFGGASRDLPGIVSLVLYQAVPVLSRLWEFELVCPALRLHHISQLVNIVLPQMRSLRLLRLPPSCLDVASTLDVLRAIPSPHLLQYLNIFDSDAPELQEYLAVHAVQFSNLRQCNMLDQFPLNRMLLQSVMPFWPQLRQVLVRTALLPRHSNQPFPYCVALLCLLPRLLHLERVELPSAMPEGAILAMAHDVVPTLRRVHSLVLPDAVSMPALAVLTDTIPRMSRLRTLRIGLRADVVGAAADAVIDSFLRTLASMSLQRVVINHDSRDPVIWPASLTSCAVVVVSNTVGSVVPLSTMPRHQPLSPRQAPVLYRRPDQLSVPPTMHRCLIPPLFDLVASFLLLHRIPVPTDSVPADLLPSQLARCLMRCCYCGAWRSDAFSVRCCAPQTLTSAESCLVATTVCYSCLAPASISDQ